MTVWTLPLPSVRLTVAPASAVPLTVAVCSAILTVLSTATGLIVGATGAVVSTVMLKALLATP